MKNQGQHSNIQKNRMTLKSTIFSFKRFEGENKVWISLNSSHQTLFGITKFKNYLLNVQIENRSDDVTNTTKFVKLWDWSAYPERTRWKIFTYQKSACWCKLVRSDISNIMQGKYRWICMKLSEKTGAYIYPLTLYQLALTGWFLAFRFFFILSFLNMLTNTTISQIWIWCHTSLLSYSV